MNAKEVATITGVSVRTLHHYDQIGLLCPNRNENNDYREYTDTDLDELQQIMFFKECGFSLKRIKDLLSSPSFNKNQAFAIQEKYLLNEKQRIEAMLDTLHKTMKATKGELIMSQKDKFVGFDFKENPYLQEAQERWGEDSISYLNSLSTEEKDAMSDKMNALFSELAELRHEAPESELVQAAMDKMYHFFNDNFGYHYSPEAFAGIGCMYVEDDRFTKSIDQFGTGLAEFLSKAIEVYSSNHK